MLTGYGNIAAAVAAVKAGVIDYLSEAGRRRRRGPRPAGRQGRRPGPARKPDERRPCALGRIQRVYQMCGHNVSETARRLNMHRRTLRERDP